MDGFLVDLDKVLDDFEEVEEKSLIPGLEAKPSGYFEYLQHTNDRDTLIASRHDPSHNASYVIKYPQQVSDYDYYNDKLSRVSYDSPFPNEDDLDLCEANFAPSPPNKSKAEILNSILISKTENSRDSPLKIIPTKLVDSDVEKVTMNNFVNHCNDDTPDHSVGSSDTPPRASNLRDFRFMPLDTFPEVESSSYSSHSLDNSEENCDSPEVGDYRLSQKSNRNADFYDADDDDGDHIGATASPVVLHNQEVVAGSFHTRPNQTPIQSAIMTDDILIIHVPETDAYQESTQVIENHHGEDFPTCNDNEKLLYPNRFDKNSDTKYIRSSSYTEGTATARYDSQAKAVGFEECIDDIDVSELDDYLHDQDTLSLQNSSSVVNQISRASLYTADNSPVIASTSKNADVLPGLCPSALVSNVDGSAETGNNLTASNADEKNVESRFGNFSSRKDITDNCDAPKEVNNDNDEAERVELQAEGGAIDLSLYNIDDLRNLPVLQDIAALSANMRNISLNYPELSEDFRGYSASMSDFSDEALEHLHAALANDDVESFPDILNNNVEANNNQPMFVIDAMQANVPQQQVVHPRVAQMEHGDGFVEAPTTHPPRHNLSLSPSSSATFPLPEPGNSSTSQDSQNNAESSNVNTTPPINDSTSVRVTNAKVGTEQSTETKFGSVQSTETEVGSEQDTKTEVGLVEGTQTEVGSVDGTETEVTPAESTEVKVREHPPLCRLKRPNSLLGLSTILLPHATPSETSEISASCDTTADERSYGNRIISPDNVDEEVVLRRHAASQEAVLSHVNAFTDPNDSQNSAALRDDSVDIASTVPASSLSGLNQPDDDGGASNHLPRPHSWSPDSDTPSVVVRQKRPTSLDLPSRADDAASDWTKVNEMTAQGTIAARQLTPYYQPHAVQGSPATESLGAAEEAGAAGMSELYTPDSSLPPVSASASTFDQLGKRAPTWVPDIEAPNCMQCEAKFTFTKRRHHCRACGKVFCASCCSHRNKIEYMDGKEARVCVACRQLLVLAHAPMHGESASMPHPNNPSDYCSTIPPHEQASTHNQLPTIMVPVVGVLKREGASRRTEPKQVIFSDGIRPGGDLTEVDAAQEATTQLPKTSPGRKVKKVEKVNTSVGAVSSVQPALDMARTVCVVPHVGLPPLVTSHRVRAERQINYSPDVAQTMHIINDEAASPAVFMVNKNLYVLVKFVNLNCCINKLCWCFTSDGLVTVGQEEVVILLECMPDETTLPNEIFLHFQHLYEQAGLGHTVSDLSHSIFTHPFLDNKDHGGLLYLRPTFQCLNKLHLPSVPYVFGVLLQKWEIPWAKVFPLRLLLRLGAEYRYYPCPLVSTRDRRPTFYEIGHTIMNLLADFRNYQYMLPQIRGVSIHMEDKQTVITFPMNRYDELMKVVSNSNEHVMALAADFSTQADSHLVCIQNEDGNYTTQAINIQNRPRKVTGASFVVFNGALKTSTGLMAKSSIIEDGLMVQITPETMAGLKQSMKDMKAFVIWCGSVTTQNPEETVTLRWGQDDTNFNVGVRSSVDGVALDGVRSLRIHKSTDYVGDHCLIRWTEVFFMKTEEGSSHWEPVDLSRLAESLARATCVALTPHLDRLKDACLDKVAIRAMIDTDQVSYDAGCNGDKLPDFYMNDLDNELIPVIHNAASQNQHMPIVLELVFHILE